MNDDPRKAVPSDAGERIAEAIKFSAAETESKFPATNPVATREALAGAPSAGGAAPRAPLVDPAVVAKTFGSLLRLVERGASRGLERHALRASGGDKVFAEALVSDWRWTDEDWHDVDGLLAQVVSQYALQDFVRPDVALLVAAAGHVVGYATLSQRLAKYAASAKKSAEPAAEKSEA